MREQITVVGNLAHDPERRRTGGGDTIASFRVGCTPRQRDAKTGEWVDGETSWYRVSAFRSLGENALASLQKGQRVVVTGHLRIRDWEAGDRRGTDAEITADAIGHDLKWGTSVFRRTQGAERAVEGEGAPDGPAVDEDGWAVPGEETPF